MTEQAKRLRLETNIRKYGSEEAWRAHMKEIGSKGGKNSTNSWLQDHPGEASRVGKLGGNASAKSRGERDKRGSI